MKFRLPALVAAVAGIAAASSCGDPTAVKAQFEIVFDTLEVSALNGTAASLPSGVKTRAPNGGMVVRVGADFDFDVAWDILPSGEAVVHTVGAVANQLVPVRRVGLLLADGPFDALLRAPASGFKYDSSLVVPVGKIVLVDVIDPTCSAFSLLGQNIRSKIQLDSVVPATRTLYMRIGANPNCGFRDLTPGLPKE